MNTYKLEVLDRIQQRAKKLGCIQQYLYFSLSHEFYIRVATICGEYIIEIVKMSTIDDKIYGSWNCYEYVTERKHNNIPTTDILGCKIMRYDHNRSVEICSNGTVKIYNVLPGQIYIYMGTVTAMQWYNFLYNIKVPEVEKYIKRRRFLETTIIESVTSNVVEYFQILDIFEKLYGMGYWTCGGFRE